MNIASNIRVTSHQERLNHNLIRQGTEMSPLVNMCRDTRRRQPIAWPTVNRIENLRSIEFLTTVINPVKYLAKDCFICILHDCRRNRDVSKPASDLLNMNSKMRTVRIVSQPSQRAPQIEQIRQRHDKRGF